MIKVFARGHDRESAIGRLRGRLLRKCLLIGVAVTALGGLPGWDPNPSPDIELIQRGIPFGWIRTCEPHGLEITVGSVTVRVPELREDNFRRPSGQVEFPVVLEPVRLLVDVAFWSVVALAALTRPRRLRRGLLVGLGLTAALAAIPYEFCSDGNAHGLPFAIVHPHGCDMPALGIQLPISVMQEWVFDLLNLGRDWLVWSVLAFAGMAVWRRRQAGRHNDIVGPDDIVVHAGDFAGRNFPPPRSYLEQLNGSHVMVRGSHDQRLDTAARNAFAPVSFSRLQEIVATRHG